MDELKTTKRLLKALSDENRLRMLFLLYNKEGLCVCEITEIIGLSQPTVSSHLKILENAGIIDYTKEGLWVNYKISVSMDADTRKVIEDIVALMQKSGLAARDLKRLSSIDRKSICSKKA